MAQNYTYNEIGQRAMQRNPDAFTGLDVTPEDIGKRIIQRNPDLQPLVKIESKKIETPPEVAQPKKDGILKSMIKAPIKSLLVKPIARTTQALAAFGAFGKEGKEKALKEIDTGEDLSYNIPLLGKYNIEAVKTGMAGVKQAGGEALESASYLIGSGGAARVGKTALKLGRATIGQAAKTTAIIGGKSGLAYGAGTALQRDEDLAGVVKGAFVSGAIGTVAGGIMGAGTQAVSNKIGSIVARKVAKKVATKTMIESGVPDSRIAAKKLLDSGKVGTDKVAKEVIRQGIPEADVALIKTSSAADKSKMLKMLDIRQSQLTNKRITDRATDVVGDTFINKIAKPIEKLNKEAGQKLDFVARKLAGQKVDPSTAITQFADDLERAGIGIQKGGKLNFKNSNFEGLKGPQQLITNVWNRAIRVAKTGDALQLHRTKSYIDEIVNYGKAAEGLSGKAQTMLKQFRHNIDGILDGQFPAYNKINTQFSDTIQQLNTMGTVIGKKFKLGDTFADAQSGLAMRRILSNTKSRADILKLLEGMQKVASKYGIKIDEDIITQANFADVLETMLGSEAPTSLMGQFSKGVETFGSSGGFGGVQQVGSAASEFARGNIIRGTIKAGGYAVDILRGVNQGNKIDALRALLKDGLKPVSNFGMVIPKIPPPPPKVPGVVATPKIITKGKPIIDKNFTKSLFKDTTERGIKTKEGLVLKGGNLDIHMKDIRQKLISKGYKEVGGIGLEDFDNPLVKDGVELNFTKGKKAINAYMRTDGQKTAITFDETLMDTGGKLHTGDNYVPNEIKKLFNIKKSNFGQESFGAVAGFEIDEDGKIKFNPKKAMLGIAAMSAIKHGKVSKKVFQGFDDITTKVLNHLKGKSITSKQEIMNFTNMPGLKQIEKDVIRNVLNAMPEEKIPVQEFAKKVKMELLPLKAKVVGARNEQTVLPDDIRGNVANYFDRPYESPIRTNVQENLPHNYKDVKNYFGHTRVEDLADEKEILLKYRPSEMPSGGHQVGLPEGSTRRVIEVQSDLYQKGALKRQIPDVITIKVQGKDIELTRNQDISFYDYMGKQGRGLYLADSKGQVRPTESEWNKYYKPAIDKIIKPKELELQKLQQYNDPTAHFRMVREEVKQAAIDGKTKLQFPTGETAMKIEGLGENVDNWLMLDKGNQRLHTGDLKVGGEIARVGTQDNWVITDILGDGKFKAIPKSAFESKYGTGWEEMMKLNPNLKNLKEAFDISGKVDTSNPIYRFYEKEIGKYLKNKYNSQLITDPQGVSWWELDVKPEFGKMPIEAFGLTPLMFKDNEKKSNFGIKK